MFCKNCGRQLKDDARFCSGCGITMAADQQQETPPPVQPASVIASDSEAIQQAPPPQQYQYAPPEPPAKPKLGKKPLFGIAGAAAAVIVFFVAIFPMIGGGTSEPKSVNLNIDIGVEQPEGRGADFEIGTAYFETNDPNIKMIEINQGLSYGFDSDSGEFYLLDNFVAGKETGIFVALDAPLDPKADIKLTIEKNDERVITLTSVELIDDRTVLFQPKDIAEVGFWGPGYYTFTYEMDDSVAVRKTNFFESVPMKILAVPILGHYSGDVRRCEGDWKLGSAMLTATYPLARDDVEYELGPEQDLSDPMYDLNTKEGRKMVWQHLMDLQTPNNEYTMIVGFMRNPTKEGILGFTRGDYATVVCESEPDLMATVVHEIAHCYIIGDEYSGGHINDGLNPPPFGMKGKDIITYEDAVGTKEYVKGGPTVGLAGTGSVVYPEQRAYWPEGRELLGTVTSYMGGGTGEDSFMFWTSSDIYNHLFRTFTGQLDADEAVSEEAEESESEKQEAELWGQCYECLGNVFDPEVFLKCPSCGEFTNAESEDESCRECGTPFMEGVLSMEDFWLYHHTCGSMLYYPAFDNYNGILASTKTYRDWIPVLEIVGDIDAGDNYYPLPWFSYEASPVALTANREGEYSVVIYDAGGKRLSFAYFDVVDNSQTTAREGVNDFIDTEVPIRVIVGYPETAAKVVIKKGSKEIYSKELSASAPKVAFTGLTEGQEISNDITLTWEAEDAENLTFQIWYMRNNEEEFFNEDVQYLVASRIKGTSYTADLTDFPGSKQGWFKILATDGGRTGMSESPKVSVPFRAPDILNQIPEGKQYKVTEPVDIQGKVYDAQDGWIWGEHYEWYVDERRFDNGGGFFFWHHPYMLPPGMHTITMKVTNSAGLSSEKDFLIEIIDDESDLPDDWPKSDITLALRMGIYYPLDRLPAPLTRVEFAQILSKTHTLAFGEESLPDDWMMAFPENILWQITDMSGEYNDMDYVYAMVAVALGLMDVNNAEVEYFEEMDLTVITCEFDPYGTLTEHEAMQAMYMNYELAKANAYTTYEILDESAFLPWLMEVGMLDEPGSFNAFKSGEKMSRGMAMVRVAKLYKYAYDLSDDKDYGSDAGFFSNYYDD